MKLIKAHLRNSLSEGTLAQLVGIAIESPEKLSEDQLEAALICSEICSSLLPVVHTPVSESSVHSEESSPVLGEA